VYGLDGGAMEGKVYKLHIRQLPHPINVEDSYIEVRFSVDIKAEKCHHKAL